MTFQMRVAGVLCVSVLAMAACARPEAKKARYMAQGQKMMEAKDYTRAILAFKNAAAAVPGDAESQYQLGRAYLAAGDVRSATRYAKRATELNPDHAGAQLLLAQQLANSADTEAIIDARERASKVAASSPDNGDAVRTLAFTELQLGRTAEAERQLRESLSRFPKSLASSVSLANILIARKDLAGAEEVLKSAVVQAPDSPDAAVALASLYAMTGRMPAAEEQVRRALQIDPKDASARLALAGIQRASGRPAEAEKTYRELSALPGYKSAHALYELQSGKTSEGISELETLAAANPADLGIRRRLLSAYEAAGKYADAERLLAAAMGKNANDPELLYLRADLYLIESRYAEAKADANTLLHRYSSLPDAHYLLSRIYQETGEPANRIHELQEAIRYNPDLLKARLELAQAFIDSHSAQAALDVLDGARASEQKLLPFILQRNWAYLAMRDFPALSKGIAEASAIAKSPDILLQSGMTQLEMQKPAAAQPLLEQALRENPEDLRIVRALYRCYLDGKQIPAGNKVFRDYAAQRPNSPWAQQSLGEWLAMTGDAVEARKAFENARALNPKFRPADVMLVHLDLTAGNTAAAREGLLRILANYEMDANAHHQLAGLDYQAGNVASALTHYKRAVQLDPSNVDALNDLAYVLLLSGRTDEAMTYAQAAQQKAPENGAVLDTFGWALYNKGVYQGAVENLQKAVKKGGGATPLYHLAMAYVKAGDIDLGEAALESALKIDSKLPEASMARQLISESVRPK